MTQKQVAWFNAKPVEFTGEPTILEVAKAHNIFIPTLCAYLPLDHAPGTCRMCLVEIADAANAEARIVTACTTPIKNGMHIYTRNERVRKMQRLQMKLLFADHDQDCKSCNRHGDCELQDVALFIGMGHEDSQPNLPIHRVFDDTSAGIVRDAGKCIRCGRCVEVCRQVQGVSALTLDGYGLDCGVSLIGAKQWKDSERCIQCGQCTLVCPTGALSEKDQTEEVMRMIDDPAVTTVLQFAPAVRVTLGEEFGFAPGENIERRLVSALKQIGIDYVMDTNFGADMVIMEEGTELLHRLRKRRRQEPVNLPMFTSCCPGWVNYVEKHMPGLTDFLSSTRSPQAVFGSLAKTMLPTKLNVKPENLRVISVMPCTAKKGEAKRPQLMKDSVPDVDVVLTVRELSRLLRRGGVHLKTCGQSDFDQDLFSINSGAGAIFGTTGGVMEAAVRTLYALTHEGETMAPLVFTPARGLDGVKECEVSLGEYGTIRLAIVHTMTKTQELIRKMARDEVMYDFIEVMACPGGCIAGGGTPRKKNGYQSFARARQEGLYQIDAERLIRQSHQNPQVLAVYETLLGEPCSEKAHELLHTSYSSKKKSGQIVDVRRLWQRLSTH